MLLSIGSLLLVLLITIYCIYHFNRNKERFSGSIDHFASILFGVSAGTLGFLLIQVTTYNLLLSILLSLFIVVCSGFLMRRLFPDQKGINVWLSSLIGATIGTVIGYMIFMSNKPILFIDVFFILFTYLFLMFFDRQLDRKDNKKSVKKKAARPSNALSIILSSILLILFLLLGINFNQIKLGTIGQPQNQTATLEQDNNLQVATIRVTRSGIEPKNTTLKAHTMIKLNFNVDSSFRKNIKLVSTELKLNVDLKSGKNMILLDNPQKGTYQFTIEPDQHKGTIIVK